jgi:hypothetical protein
VSATLLGGSLEAFPVWEVVQWIAQSGPEGSLEIENGRGELVRLHCRDGVLLALDWEAESSAPAGFEPCAGRLGGILAAGGRVGRPQLRLALAAQTAARAAGRPVAPLGDLLRAAGAIAPEALAEALRTQARERFLGTLEWTGGRFRFRAGPPPHAGIAIGQRLERWLLERARDLDVRPHPEPRPKTEG